jgi:hypothetical protein
LYKDQILDNEMDGISWEHDGGFAHQWQPGNGGDLDLWDESGSSVGDYDITKLVVGGAAALTYFIIQNGGISGGPLSQVSGSYNSGLMGQPTVSPNPPSYGLGCGLQCNF